MEAALDELASQAPLRSHAGHLDPQASRTRFADVAERWWTTRTVEATTAAAGRSRLDRHVLPEFGQRQVGGIRHLDVAACVGRLSKELAPATVRDSYRLLAAVLDVAVRETMIASNPCAGVALPPIRRGERPALPTSDHVDMLAAAMPERYQVAVLFGAYAGLRWGEIVGLRAGRVDMLRRELHVVEVGEEVGGRVTYRGYPKSEAGRRVVPLPDVLLDGLAAHLGRYPAGPRDLVVQTTTGTSPLRSNRRREWRRALEVAGLSSALRFHDLRHLYASALADAGTPPHVLQAVVGHGNAATTLAIYAHADRESLASVRAVFGRRADGLPIAGR